MKALVIYHNNCTDGFGAAYAAWRALGDNAHYVPANYGDCVISDDSISINDQNFTLPGREVYILDFSLPVSEMLILTEKASRVIWIDHHKSAILDWCGQDYNLMEEYVDDTPNYHIHLNNQHSGAWLAWDHFHPDWTMPKLIEHIEDRDLWKFQMRYTKEIIEGLRQNPQTFSAWDEYLRDDKNLLSLEVAGSVLMQAIQKRTEQVANGKPKHINLRDINGEWHHFIAANVINDISEAGHALNIKYSLPSLTFFIKDMTVICSLRSQDDFDVSLVAKVYGGGGHKNAAGFKVPVRDFFSYIWVG